MAGGGQETYVVLGAGLAGYSAASTLRLKGFDGRIVLIGGEPVPPYERPPLSKAFLQGKKSSNELVFQPAGHFEQELRVELRLNRLAVGLDLAARRLSLDDGATLAYDKLLIATGASPIRLRGHGFELPGVRYLRTLADAESLMALLSARQRVVVIGAGFIGSEAAASLRVLGHDVTLVDVQPAPLSGPLGERLGAIYAEIHRRNGVTLHMADRVTALHGDKHVEAAELAGGARIPCDLVVVGVGVRPAVELFAESGLKIDNGIVCDEFCRSSDPHVYAAGDVANWWHAGLQRRLRVEHYDNAALQGAAAANAMLGQGEPYSPLPYFWSDQYDTNLQYVGYPIPWDDLVLRGDTQAPSLTAFYLKDGAVTAAATINRPRELRAVRRIVEAGACLDPAVLADEQTDLRALSRNLPA